MREANGTYKNSTLYVYQIKHKSNKRYIDNITNKVLGTDLKGLVEYIDEHKNLDWRIIKRTVKEDIVY